MLTEHNSTVKMLYMYSRLKVQSDCAIQIRYNTGVHVLRK